MSSTQNSPVTRSAAAKLWTKRKGDRESQDDVEMDAAPAVAAGDDTPSSKRRKLPVRSKEDEAEAEEEDNSEDNSEEDSDDEAPEAVSTVQAAAATRKSAQTASKAADERAADQKRKRQERDARLKAQAEVRKEREDKEAAEAQIAAEAAAKIQAQEEKAQKKKAAAVAAKVKEAESKLLPLEFLESDSEEEDAAIAHKQAAKAAAKAAKQPRQRVQLAKAPKDRMLGTTAFRVLEDTVNTSIAPKSHSHSTSSRQEMMARKRVGKPKSSGFLVRK
ncbi:u3 snorna associated protein [Ophiostoma piceae UAMH 11346]|uniref:U3 snorna associated protein n=1 Tax=Ophiostoma piceae (strain UAMH 11346) TaxID=1262450 RepID=S3C9Z2_OPHP1|nr:u3 snorna associated protein [Ophiostoma piceae UAMH 11346]